LICAATQALESLRVSMSINTQGTMLLSHVAATADPPWTQMLQATNQDTQIIIIGRLLNMWSYPIKHSVHKTTYHCCLWHCTMLKTIMYQPCLCHLFLVWRICATCIVMVCKIRMLHHLWDSSM